MATKTRENIEESKKSIKYCRHCKKKVVLSLDCEICATSYHPSCAQQAKILSINNKLVCCKNSEVKPIQSKSMDESKIKTIIKEVLAEFLEPFKKAIENQISDMKTSVQYMSDSFDENKLATEEIINEVKRLRQENIKLQKKVQILETKINNQEQKEKQKNIIVVGVPKQQPDDNVKNTISKITTALKITNAEEDVLEVYRIGKMVQFWSNLKILKLKMKY